MIMNLGMSENFGAISPELQFPAHFLIDYVRAYQPKGQKDVGCSPNGFPTTDYINTFIDAYNNPNLTTWEQYSQTPPPNRLVDDCPA